MPAAAIIPAVIGAGASVAGAAMSSKAAKNAANTQSASTNQALAFQQRAYDDQRRLMQPYVNAGQGATTALGRLLTPGQAYTPQLQAQDAGQTAQGWSSALSLGPQQGRQSPPMSMQGPAGIGAPRPVQPPPSPSGGLQGAMRNVTGGGMVTLRAPTGETMSVPEAKAQGLIARGAQRVA
jgi:hypothetical protein